MGAGPDPSPFPITDEPTMTNEMPGLSGRDVIDVRTAPGCCR
jgi:hypothetical protein